MRRFLAILLVLIMPVCALAEAYEVSVGIKVDENAVASLVKVLQEMAPELHADLIPTVTRVLQILLKDCHVQMIAQKNATAFEVKINSKSLCDLTVRSDGNETVLTSSLVAGYALVADLQQAEHVPANQARINELTAELQAAVQSWLAEQKPVITYGSFHGDAFEGGTVCSTWTLTDKDIATALDALMTPQFRTALAQCIPDTVEYLDVFEQKNEQVAAESKHHYLLRVIRNDQDELVGISLSALDEDAQLATLSIGIAQAQICVVLGLGLNDVNYWWKGELRFATQKKTTYLKGLCQEWAADKTQAFAYVEKTNAPISNYAWNCQVSKFGNRYLWDGSLCSGTEIDSAKELIDFSGSCTPAQREMEAAVSFMQDGREMTRLDIAAKPTQQIPAQDAALKKVSLSELSESDLYSELSAKLTISLAGRLMMIFPLDMLTIFSDLIIP